MTARLRVPAPPRVDNADVVELRFAGVPRRLAALAIDFAILIAVGVVVVSVPLLGVRGDDEGAFWFAIVVLFWALLVMSGVQIIYFWLGNSLGGTPGKRIVGARIVTGRGTEPGLGRGTIRYTVMVLVPSTIAGLLYGVVARLVGSSGGASWAVILAAFAAYYSFVFTNPRRQALHDMVAGTYVVLR